MAESRYPAGVEMHGPEAPGIDQVLAPEAVELLAKLHRAFDGRRKELLARRAERQARLDAGERPDFLPETADVRAGDWRGAPSPDDPPHRRVAITGPVDPDMALKR